jgi:hypothetical protein
VSRTLTHRIALALCATALGATALTLPAVPSGAAQGATVLPVKAVVTKSDADIDAIRTFFFCQTSTCKKSLKGNSAAAAAALKDIEGEIKLMKSDKVPSPEKAIVAKYVVDASALVKAFKEYPVQSSADDQSNNIGIIYYQSSNVGSDTYVLGCIHSKTAVGFKVWSVGVVGVAYAMQVDTQAETATAPATTIISANESLLAEAQSMESDANGPNANFNKLVVQFAKTQIKDSRDSLLYMSSKGKAVKGSTLKALAASLSTQFKTIAALQNKLAK